MTPSHKSNNKPKVPKAAHTPQHEWSFSAIGTEWWIGIYERISPPELERLHELVAARIDVFDLTYSRFRADSLITRISKQAGTYEFPPDGEKLFAFYRKLYDATNGLVTPLIGQVLVDAGYDAHYSLKPGVLKEPPKWDDVLTIRSRVLTAAQPILLDVGAAGKGYLVDLVSELLQGEGVSKFCVDGGGDLRASRLDEPLRIGLENPHNTDQVVGVALVQDGALCGSAGSRRTWGEFHHIINPETLTPVREVQAAWTSAATGLEADGLATALFFASPEHLRHHFHFAYCIIDDDNKLQRSADFRAELFTEG
jgi:thiamine biosynthesis lipoprotein